MDYSFPIICNLLLNLLGLEDYQVRLVLVKATCLWYSILQWLWSDLKLGEISQTGRERSHSMTIPYLHFFRCKLSWVTPSGCQSGA